MLKRSNSGTPGSSYRQGWTHKSSSSDSYSDFNHFHFQLDKHLTASQFCQFMASTSESQSKSKKTWLK